MIYSTELNSGYSQMTTISDYSASSLMQNPGKYWSLLVGLFEQVQVPSDTEITNFYMFSLIKRLIRLYKTTNIFI